MTKKNENIKNEEVKIEETTVEEEQVVDIDETEIEEEVKESAPKRMLNYCKTHKKQIGKAIAGVVCFTAGYMLKTVIDTKTDDDFIPAIDQDSEPLRIEDSKPIDVETSEEEIIEE